MSSRNFRKLYGSTLPPHNSDDSDGDYDPFYVSHVPRSTFEGLECSSEGSDNDSISKTDEVEGTEDVANKVVQVKVSQKKLQKQKGKVKKNATAAGRINEINEVTASTSGHFQVETLLPDMKKELDEIDKSIKEINALLGPPPPAPESTTYTTETNSILDVQAKHLNVTYELKKLFGPDEPDEVRVRKKTQPYRERLLKRVMISPCSETKIYNFKKTGLSMTVDHREQDVTHFVYVHDEDHQKMQHSFLERHAITTIDMHNTVVSLDMEDIRAKMHVESLLETADNLFRVEEYDLANELVENTMAYLQYVAHPSFNLSSSKVRLLYEYIENRPFHVAMLKYMYLLTNRACHRTALEIAKMLLNIDSSDPLAVMLVIDVIAIRAREHEWLVAAIDYFDKERDAKRLFNIMYSYALAHFHVATKNKKDYSYSSHCLQMAIMAFPRVVLKILEFTNMSEPRIQDHPMFSDGPVSGPAEGLNLLMTIYAKMTWSRWKEPKVIDWFLKNAISVTKKYDNKEECKNAVREYKVLRYQLFQSWPIQIWRHISIIDPMSNLLLEMPLNVVTRPVSGWDPLFDSGINRYNYKLRTDQRRSQGGGRRAILFRFFSAIMPNAPV